AGPSGADDDAFRASVDRLTAIVNRADQTAAIVLGPLPLAGSADAVSTSFVDAELRWVGSGVRVTSYAGGPAAVRAVLTVTARAADLLSGKIGRASCRERVEVPVGGGM